MDTVSYRVGRTIPLRHGYLGDSLGTFSKQKNTWKDVGRMALKDSSETEAVRSRGKGLAPTKNRQNKTTQNGQQTARNASRNVRPHLLRDACGLQVETQDAHALLLLFRQELLQVFRLQPVHPVERRTVGGGKGGRREETNQGKNRGD